MPYDDPATFNAVVERFLQTTFVKKVSFAVWLTVKGVNMARWQEEAGRSNAFW